jgi:hypothetical protein
MGQGEPVCLAFLLCEEFLHDPVTGKSTLLGLLDDTRVESLPALCPGLLAYAEFMHVGGRRDLLLRLARLVHAGGTPAQLEAATTLKTWSYPVMPLRDPRKITKIGYRLDDMDFSHAGEHVFTLEVGGVILAARPFTVRLAWSAT